MKYNELSNKFEAMSKNNENILKNYRYSILNLKKTAIHPAMQTDQVKSLIDIYFDEQKMNDWKEKCTSGQEFLGKKIMSKAELINEEIKNINHEKMTKIESIKKDWNDSMKYLEGLVENSEAIVLSIISKLVDDSKTLFNIISQEDITFKKESQRDYSNDTLNELMLKYSSSNIDNLQGKILSCFYDCEETQKKLKDVVFKNLININMIFSNFHNIKKSLIELVEKLQKYNELLVKVETDFSYLSHPSQFPEAYSASLLEVKRRLYFNRVIFKILDKARNLVIKENSLRMRFIKDYGKYLTHDYIPSLKFVDLRLTIDLFNNNENNMLPYLLEEHEEEEIQLFSTRIDIIDINKGFSNDESLDIKEELKNIRKTQGKEIEDLEEKIRILSVKLDESSVILNAKERENKSLINKLDTKDKKISQFLADSEKFASAIEKLSTNYINQLKIKQQKLNEKDTEIQNLLKANKGMIKSDCLMCRDKALNSVEYHSWSNYLETLNNEKSELKNNLYHMQNSTDETIRNLGFVKKVILQHLSVSQDQKNSEIMRLRQETDLKISTLEEQLRKERDSSTQQIQRKEDQMKKYSNDIEKKVREISSKLSNMTRDMDLKSKENESLRLELSNLENYNNDLKQELEEANNLANMFKNQNNELYSEAKQLREEIEAIGKEKASIEATWKTKMEIQAKQLTNKLNSLQGELDKRTSNIKELNCILSEKNQMLKDYEEQVENSNILISKNKQDLEDLNSLLSKQEKEKSNLRKRLEELESINSCTISNTNNNNIHRKTQYDLSDIVKVSSDNFFSLSTTKWASTENNHGLSNINVTTLRSSFLTMTSLSQLKGLKKG